MRILIFSLLASTILAESLPLDGPMAKPIKPPASMQEIQAPSKPKPPQSLQELADKNIPTKKIEMKSKKILIACYDDMEEACRAAKRRLNSCAPPIEIVSLPNNPSPKDYEKAITANAVAENTPLIIIGHGTAAPKLSGMESPEKIDSAIQQEKDYVHQLSEKGSTIKRGKELSVRIPKGVYTEDILDTLEELPVRPQVWMMSCLGGMACEGKRAICIGAICQRDEVVKSNTALDGSTRALLDLYCSKDEFNKADRETMDGILDADELTKYFCEHAAGARPFIEFSPAPKGNAETNAQKLKEYIRLLLTKIARPLNDSEHTKLLELEELNRSDSPSRFSSLSNQEISEDLKLLVAPLRSPNGQRIFKADIVSGHRWIEAPSVYNESQTVLRLELPQPPDSRGCFFVPSKSNQRTFTHKPLVNSFKLKFFP